LRTAPPLEPGARRALVQRRRPADAGHPADALQGRRRQPGHLVDLARLVVRRGAALKFGVVRHSIGALIRLKFGVVRHSMTGSRATWMMTGGLVGVAGLDPRFARVGAGGPWVLGCLVVADAQIGDRGRVALAADTIWLSTVPVAQPAARGPGEWAGLGQA
jgi:hypothetical protein